MGSYSVRVGVQPRVCGLPEVKPAPAGETDGRFLRACGGCREGWGGRNQSLSLERHRVRGGWGLDGREGGGAHTDLVDAAKGLVVELISPLLEGITQAIVGLLAPGVDGEAAVGPVQVSVGEIEERHGGRPGRAGRG